MRFQNSGLRYWVFGVVLTVAIVALAIAVHSLAGAGSPAPLGMVWIPAGEFAMGSNAEFARPDEKPAHQTAIIHAGNGRNVIYANDTVNYVWTGSNPKTVVHAFLAGTSGVIHCQSPGIVVYLSKTSQHHFKLDGCRRISHYSVGY